MQSAINKLPLVLTLLVALTVSLTQAQTSSARGQMPSAEEMPLADYLGLLQQIAPAAEAGAKAYLAAMQQRCGRDLSTGELRQAITQGGGDPVLMGLIRASHLKDTAAQAQWIRQLRCPGKEER